MEQELRQQGDPTGRFPGKYTTMNVAIIEGGVEPNIIPARCRFVWGFRHIPGTPEEEILERFNRHAAEAVLPAMRSKSPDTNIETRQVIAFDGLMPVENNPAEELGLRCRGHSDSRTDFFGTEAGLFQKTGIPTVVCGPGDIIHAHRANEHTTVEQVNLCRDFLIRLAEELGHD
jgi:acetylornithine deacetylase